MISNPAIEVQTTSENRFSVPAWFAEVVIIAGYLEKKGLLEAFAQQVRLVRGHFGTYEPIDCLALLIGYAISGERTLAEFFERVAPFATAFMALFGRKHLPHRSSLSRFLADVNHPCVEAFRILFEQDSEASGWTTETIGGVFDRQGRRYIVFDVDATRQAARQRNGGSRQSARLATPDASAERWSAHVPQRCKCIRASGSAPMQVEAMVIIVVNSPRHSKPSRPI